MLARFVEKRVNAHPVEKHKNITKQNREGMSHEEIIEALPFRGLQIIILRHDGKGTDVRAAQLGVVVVVVVVGTAPHATRAENQNAKNLHQPFHHPGTRQDGMMLLIVINDKKTQEEQTGHQAATDPGRKMEVPQGTRQRQRQQRPG